MALREEFAGQGLWLFRWRSLLPLLAMALILGLMLCEPQATPAWAHGLPWQLACVAVSVLGLAVRIVTVGRVPHDTSRRSTRQQTAAEINRTGMYSVVRHPLYLGNYLMWLGVAMAPGIWWLAALITLAYALYYERIMYSEEEFLRAKFGQDYLDWAEQTPAILPGFGRWKPAALPFSWRTVLRRENASAFALMVAFTLVGLAGDYETTHPFAPDRSRLLVFGIGLAIYLVLRFFKRHTRLLHVAGR
jgi:protein-S-isoprenylcysteine O-methyltransferase Ste14